MEQQNNPAPLEEGRDAFIINLEAIPLDSIPEDYSTCIICQDDFANNSERAVQLRCSHIIGEDCIAIWASQELSMGATNQCPYCKTELYKRSPEEREYDIRFFQMEFYQDEPMVDRDDEDGSDYGDDSEVGFEPGDLDTASRFLQDMVSQRRVEQVAQIWNELGDCDVMEENEWMMVGRYTRAHSEVGVEELRQEAVENLRRHGLEMERTEEEQETRERAQSL